jgi:hypothetical protein
MNCNKNTTIFVLITASFFCKETQWRMAEAVDTGEWSGEEDQEEALGRLFSTERPPTSEEAEHLEEDEDTKEVQSVIEEQEDGTETEYETKMETEAGRQMLGATFYQCRAAREAKMTETIFDLTTGLKTTEPYKRIGTMDRQEDRLLGKTFHGARANKYSRGISVEVNQGITCSYDPATLMCMLCSTEHKITEERQGGLPATLVFTDQNFISGFSGDGSSCVSVCRVENCSLTELTDMVIEVLEGISLKPGTLILMGSTTHLHRVGVSMYAGEWASCVEKLEQKWGGGARLPTGPASVL